MKDYLSFLTNVKVSWFHKKPCKDIQQSLARRRILSLIKITTIVMCLILVYSHMLVWAFLSKACLYAEMKLG